MVDRLAVIVTCVCHPPEVAAQSENRVLHLQQNDTRFLERRHNYFRTSYHNHLRMEPTIVLPRDATNLAWTVFQAKRHDQKMTSKCCQTAFERDA
eukprot:5667272-Amphidinium_carterae.1